MAKYEIGWNESHYMEIEADTWEEADKIVNDLTDARERSVMSYEGLIGDICIWEVLPDMEVSESMRFNYDTEVLGYNDLTETNGDGI